MTKTANACKSRGEDLLLIMTEVVPAPEPRPIGRPQRHTEWYFDDKFHIFQVEHTLFRVRALYLSESPLFQDMLSLPPPSGGQKDGLTDDQPIQLSEDKADVFAFTLCILRCHYDCGRAPKGRKQQWISALRFAHKYQLMEAVEDVALIKLAEAEFEPLERIQLYDALDIHLLWSADAILALLTSLPIGALTAQERGELRRSMKPETWDVIAGVRECYLIANVKYHYSGRCGTRNDIVKWIETVTSTEGNSGKESPQ